MAVIPPHLGVRPLGRPEVDLLLINVPQRVYTVQNPRLGCERVLPPLGLAYLATYLEWHGVRVGILDGEFAGASIEDICDTASSCRARAYGVNCYSPTAPLTYALANGLKATGRPVFIGGVHATYAPDDVDRACPGTHVLRGYAERNLLIALSRELNDTTTISDLDPLNLRLSREHLAADPHEKRGRRSASLLSSRGCPYSCTFCTSASTAYVRRPIEDVVSEIADLRARYAVSHIQFLDDLFLSAPARTRAFAAQKASADLTDVSWQGLATVKTLALHATQGAIDTLADSGCAQLSVGFESGSERIRRLAGKEYRAHDAITAVQACSQRRIRTKGFFMVGFPGETMTEIQDTVNWIFRLRDSGLTDISLFQVKLYPGTRLREMAFQSLGTSASDDYYEYDLRFTTSHTTAMRAFSRESYGNRTQLCEATPWQLEQVIQRTTERFYQH